MSDDEALNSLLRSELTEVRIVASQQTFSPGIPDIANPRFVHLALTAVRLLVDEHVFIS